MVDTLLLILNVYWYRISHRFNFFFFFIKMLLNFIQNVLSINFFNYKKSLVTFHRRVKIFVEIIFYKMKMEQIIYIYVIVKNYEQFYFGWFSFMNVFKFFSLPCIITYYFDFRLFFFFFCKKHKKSITFYL